LAALLPPGAGASGRPTGIIINACWKVVAGGGIEPPTQGFSVLCSTD
jgi:hypothetical protein